MKESDLQKQCIEYLTILNQTTERDNLLFYAPMNEGVMMVLKLFGIPETRASKIISWLIKMGFLSGVSDIVLLYQGITHYLEIKKQKGKQSKNQIEFQRRAQTCGANYMIIRSLDELKDYLQKQGIHIII